MQSGERGGKMDSTLNFGCAFLFGGIHQLRSAVTSQTVFSIDGRKAGKAGHPVLFGIGIAIWMLSAASGVFVLWALLHWELAAI